MTDALDKGLAQAFGKGLSGELQLTLKDLFRSPLIGADAERLVFADGTSVPVRGHVPRFVADDAYADSFSFQWATFPQTQVDSAQNVQLSEREVHGKANLSEEVVRGKTILDAGVGIGRHSEIYARWGGRVIGVDLSGSVDMAYRNLAAFDNAVVVQADLGDLPFRDGSFDIVSSIGVLHHTPDTKEYARRLVRLLRPGGILTVWVYSEKFARRKQWIPVTSRIPHPAFYDWSVWIVDWLRQDPEHPMFRYVSQEMDFFFGHSTTDRAVLSLFDGYTPAYHGVHSPTEVSGWFKEFGLTGILRGRVETAVFGRKPLG